MLEDELVSTETDRAAQYKKPSEQKWAKMTTNDIVEAYKQKQPDPAIDSSQPVYDCDNRPIVCNKDLPRVAKQETILSGSDHVGKTYVSSDRNNNAINDAKGINWNNIQLRKEPAFHDSKEIGSEPEEVDEDSFGLETIAGTKDVPGVFKRLGESGEISHETLEFNAITNQVKKENGAQ
ncbi:hypothetical protein ACG1BZ_12220 [Microbulbifer sp. CNSA002]|uniref:hypothetical protein n=1 Tax=Microbulbifer sp. CNSA002 TaxID=3373604 RepID=UPI0039B522BD